MKITNTSYEAVLIDADYESGLTYNYTNNPSIRDFHFENIDSAGSRDAIRINSLSDNPVHDISFANISVITRKGSVIIDNANNIFLNHVVIHNEQTPVFQFTDSQNISLEDSPCPIYKKNIVCLEINGQNLKNIHFLNSNIDYQKISPGINIDKNNLQNIVSIQNTASEE